MPTMTELPLNCPFFQSFWMASDTEVVSRISPSTTEPGGRPTWPYVIRTGVDFEVSISAARTALVPMSSPTVRRAMCLQSSGGRMWGWVPP